ncbi:RAB11-binding protein RELCH homolog [Planococcus citri]|uniref:RAB11-binding protein RELCH homolog n=1 Tax=Planococcus citri TaxID=170843 RepID=UPI0031F971AE
MEEYVAENETNTGKFSDEPKDVNINYFDIASKLLNDRLLLTALELHCELSEAGKEVPQLKEFFSNPGNFEQPCVRPELSPTILTRWSSQATLDSLDMTRYSEDGEKVVDDRVAVLEFELRKAKETINALRTNLTVATECETPTSNKNSKSCIYDPIKPHEQRALNYLINEYLLMHGYKLTSITFADENEDQDFEVWDDVGLNIPKPPELLHLYRDSMRSSHVLHATYQTTFTQTDYCIEEVELLVSQLDKLNERIAELEQENKELYSSLENMKADTDGLETVTTHFAAPTSESGSLPDHFIMVDSNQLVTAESNTNLDQNNKTPDLSESAPSKFIDVVETIDSDESTSHSNEWLKLNENEIEKKTNDKCDILGILAENSDRHVPVHFQKEVLNRCYVEVGSMPGHCLLEQFDSEDILHKFVHIIAGTVHKIVSNIPPNFREDLILLIAYTILHHPVSSIREKLIQLLFNLKKKPRDDERKAILSSLIWLACNADISLVENEVLPLCWEELSHKYIEKRLLISELCCALAPFLSSISRSSLLLSLLQQILLEDKDDRVKASAINSISFITTFIDDDNKYAQCEELLFTALQDSSSGIVEITTLTLLPVLTKWAFDIDKLQSHLIPRLLRLLETQIKTAAVQHKGDHGSPFKQNFLWETKCIWTVSAIRSILPYLVMHVTTAPIVLQSINSNLPQSISRTGFSDVCRGLCNPAIFYEGKNSLGEIVRAFDAIVENTDWSQLEWLLTAVISKFLEFLVQVNVSQEELLKAFITLFHSITSGFGKTAVDAKIKPLFQEQLKIIESKLADVSKELPNLSILPVYLFSVVVPLQEVQDLQNTFRRFLFILPISGYPINILEFCVKELNQINFAQEILLSVLWEGVVHSREAVRSVVVKLFSSIIPSSSDFIIVNRIMPAIVTLSNDADLGVKTATIQVFGTLIKETSNKEISDKCCFQLQTFLSEQNLLDNHTTLVQLIYTFGQIASDCDFAFREDVIVPQLSAFAASTLQLTNQTRKQELSRVLLDAYSAVIYCSFTKSTITSALLPGLRCLEAICADSMAHRETISSMIKEVEARSGLTEPTNNSNLSSVTANMGQEVKQRMSKIFQTPISKQNKFWKK